MVKGTNLKKYVSIFAVTHLGMMIVGTLLLTLLDLEGNAGINIGIFIASAMAAGQYFIRDHQRLPTASEKTGLILLSLLASTLVSLVFIACIAVFEPEGVEAIWLMLLAQPSFFLMMMAAALLVCLFVLWLTYGFMLRKQFVAMQKKADI